MSERQNQLRAFARYMALQLPSTLIAAAIIVFGVRWLEWPRWTMVAGIVLWVAHDLALYPFVRRVFDGSAPDRVGPRLLIGAAGRSVERLSPTGYVKVRGELWKAELECVPTLAAGEPVLVRSVRGLRLMVVPDDTVSDDRDGIPGENEHGSERTDPQRSAGKASVS